MSMTYPLLSMTRRDDDLFHAMPLSRIGNNQDYVHHTGQEQHAHEIQTPICDRRQNLEKIAWPSTQIT
jgi:hypothetical protein